MTTISIVNTKGGVGKTTTAVYLAAYAGYQGHHTRLIDTDPQGTASKWLTQALENNDPVTNCELMVGNVATLGTIPKDGINIIDTPPGNSTIIDRAVAEADFVIVPTAPSLTDLDRVWDTLSIIPAGTPAAVLLTQAKVQALLTDQTRKALEADDALVFPVNIPNREKFNQAFGSWPNNDMRAFYGYDRAFTDIMEGLN